VLDHRVPVVGGEIPLVYLKRRPLRDRFSNTNLRVGLADAGEVFSAAERERLLAFCRAMGLDLGEIDVLRDAGDGRIYVVDVNRTAWGPPRSMRTADAVRAVRAYAAALSRLAEARLP
jgi:glutathione synthase/RimK-type ligase-like ATP-grasp enzyme